MAFFNKEKSAKSILKSSIYIFVFCFVIFLIFFCSSPIVNAQLLPEYNWSVQSGSASFTSASNSFSVNIQAVNISQSFVLFRQRMASSANTMQASKFYAQLPNQTSVLFVRNGTTGTINFEYYVISSPTIKVQQGTSQYKTNQNSINLSISGYNESKTIVIVEATCNTTTNADWHESFWRGNMTNSTNLQLRRDGATSCAGTVGYFAVEFINNTNIRQGELKLTTLSSTVPIPQINTSNTLLLFQEGCNIAAVNMNACGVKGNVSNSTSLTFDRLSATGNVSIQWYTLSIPGAKIQRGESPAVTTGSYAAQLSPLVNSNKSFSFISVKNSGSATRYSRLAWTSLIALNGTVLNILRDDTTLNNYINWQVLEFPIQQLSSISILSLDNPQNSSSLSYHNVDFNFTAFDLQSNITNCTLWSNFSGIWNANTTIFGVLNNISENISLYLKSGSYIWNILCMNGQGLSNFYNSNFSLTIQNQIPTLTNIKVSDQSNQLGIVDLLVGQQTSVFCNGTLVDGDGFSDILKINATIFHTLFSNSTLPDNATKHYTNTSCNFTKTSVNSSDFNCKFGMQYYSMNGTWKCNVTAFDSFGYSTSAALFNISALLAINVTPIIDFGTLFANNISQTDSIAIVSNLGNTQIDLNLYGYGSFPGDNNSMICTYGNIPINYTRYNFTSGLAFNSMTKLIGSLQGVTYTDFNLNSQTNSTLSSRNTYWKLQMPKGTRGQCTGNIVFSAIRS